MTVHQDGSNVFYSGDPRPGAPAYGDEGRVLVADTRAAHVKWTTGSRAGQVDLVEQTDLAEVGETISAPAIALHAHLGESLAYCEPPQRRAHAVLEAMAEAGETDRFGLLAEEAVDWIAGRLRTSGYFRAHMAALASAEADELVTVATRRVLADALESMEADDHES